MKKITDEKLQNDAKAQVILIALFESGVCSKALACIRDKCCPYANCRASSSRDFEFMS